MEANEDLVSRDGRFRWGKKKVDGFMICAYDVATRDLPPIEGSNPWTPQKSLEKAFTVFRYKDQCPCLSERRPQSPQAHFMCLFAFFRQFAMLATIPSDSGQIRAERNTPNTCPITFHVFLLPVQYTSTFPHMYF